MTISTDLIILAYGQSNEQGIGPTILAGDQDASGTIVEYHSAGSEIPGVQPLSWADGTDSGPSRSFAMAQELIPQMASGKKIVIIPEARSAAGIGTLQNPAGAAYIHAAAQLTAALGEYPGARVIMSWTQGERDAVDELGTAGYISAFNTLVGQFRGIVGAENMEVILHQLAPEKINSDAEYALIDAAHKQIPLQLAKCWFVGATLGYLAPANANHYNEAGNRLAGVRAAAQVDFANTLSAVAPQVVSEVLITAGSVTFNTSAGGASGYNVQLRNRGSADAWTDNVIYPTNYLDPGAEITVALATTGKETRVIAKSFGGDSAAVPQSKIRYLLTAGT